MKKKITAVCALTALIFSMTAVSAAENTGEELNPAANVEDASPIDITMKYDEYPRVDGSLACVPLLEALAVRATGCTQTQAEETLNHFSNTNPCYINMAEGARDLLLAYEPAQETKDALLAYDPLDMRPVGKDALVFIVNAANPVESLTAEQVLGIYTGKITNWKEVGGNDEEIVAFSRPETSGSQTLMRKLLLGDEQMIDPQIQQVPSMEGIIDQIKYYDNSANAIGYSVFYYASSMYDQPELKFIAVDGVMPSNDSIRTGEYTLVNDFYVVTCSNSSEKAVLLRDWLLSAEGQKFVEECGYVPVS